MTTAEAYEDFATHEAHGVSPTYERLALAVCRDEALLALLDTLPPAKRQPNLLFGVARFLGDFSGGFRGGPVEDPETFRDFTVKNWPAVEKQMRTRATQTNEAGRCAVLLPVLAALPQPLALLEVGASAGLCLYPDRYSYRYGNHVIGTNGPVLTCDASTLLSQRPDPDRSKVRRKCNQRALYGVPCRNQCGSGRPWEARKARTRRHEANPEIGTAGLPAAEVPAAVAPVDPAAVMPVGPAAVRPVGPAAVMPMDPAAVTPVDPAAVMPVGPAAASPMGPAAVMPVGVPEVVWRAGLDLNPLDVTDPADVAWLDALIWPEHSHRRARLRAAAAIAAAEPPLLVRGDLVDDLPALAAQAPSDATLVVFHTSVLYQVPAPKREAFAEVVRGLPGHWIANEAADVLPYATLPEPPDQAMYNVLALDGTPLAWTRSHGQAMVWFG